MFAYPKISKSTAANSLFKKLTFAQPVAILAIVNGKLSLIRTHPETLILFHFNPIYMTASHTVIILPQH
jgi:hypothetical protein